MGHNLICTFGTNVLTEKIYYTQKIPEQWKVSKIIPVFKKGNVHQIENYRPIANLCSASKFFERLILKQINYLDNKNALTIPENSNMA